MKALLRLHRCADLHLNPRMSTYPISTIITWTGLFFCNIITIVIIHAVNHSYKLSYFSINVNIFSLFLHILCSKRGRHLSSPRKQILVLPCICPIFFLSILQIIKFFVVDFCDTVQARVVIFGMQVNNDVLYCGIGNQPSAAFSPLYLFHFHFLSIL